MRELIVVEASQWKNQLLAPNSSSVATTWGSARRRVEGLKNDTRPKSLWDATEKSPRERDFQLIAISQQESLHPLPNRVEGLLLKILILTGEKLSTSPTQFTLSPVPTVLSYSEFRTLILCEEAEQVQYLLSLGAVL